MKIIVMALLALLISSVPSQALTTTPVVEIKLGKPFKLQWGAGYEYLGLYAKGKVKVYFLRVIRDSRCPVKTQCLWAGDAELEFSIQQGLVARKFVLNTFSKTQSPNIFGYRLEVRDLKPEHGVRPKVNESVTLRLLKP
jgi:hypothetical protein